jgi:hypothetical protein
MKNLNQYFILILLVITTLSAFGQVGEIISPSDRPIEFSIPISPAFDMLGVNPSEVMKPGTIKDIKVDWSFQSWRLKPNLAIQVQPVWELFYNKADLKKYQKATPLMRMLSSLDISAGTIENDLLERHVAIAVKLTVYQQKDPLNEPQLYTASTKNYYEQKKQTEALIKSLQDTIPKMVGKPEQLENLVAFRGQLQEAQRQLVFLETSQKQRITQLATLYVQENWNAAYVDVAFGRSLSFENSQLDSLNRIGNEASAWVNWSQGIGRKGLITGIIKYSALEFEQTQSNEFLIGLNGRYGSAKFNFFTEIGFRKNTINDAFITLAYGGDWRINKNIMLSYGVRTIYDNDFSFKTLIPVASISCMMR